MTDLAQSAKARILFVDDEPRILVAMKALFRSQYDVFTASSGAQAVELLQTEAVDVVVSDQRMPNMTGVEVLREARKLRPRAIRVLLTGYSDLSAILDAINDGEIFRYINKPWSNPDLRATIAAAVAAAEVEDLAAELPANRDVAASADNAPAPAEAAPEAAPVPANVLPLTAAPLSNGPGLLVLDDDEKTCLTLQRVLGRDRPVYTAHTLESALSILERHEVGVIISEVAVAGESVIDLLSALRQHHPSLVAIVLASQADAGQSIELINQGQIYRFLNKPVGEGMLRGSVNLAFRRFDILKSNPNQTRRLVADVVPDAAEKKGIFKRIGQLFGRRA